MTSRHSVAATVALLAATLVWGSTFLVTKASLADLNPSSFLLWRFGVAAIVLVATGYRRVLALTAVLNTGRPSGSVLRGLIGLMLVTSGMFQNFT